MPYLELIVSIRNTRILLSLKYKGWQGTGALRVLWNVDPIDGQNRCRYRISCNNNPENYKYPHFYSMIKILFFPATKHEQKVFSNNIVQQDQGTNRMMIKETCDLSGLGALSGYSSIPDRMRIQISVVK